MPERIRDAQRHDRRLEDHVLEALGEAVVIAFPDGRLRLNRAAREALGVADAEVDRTEFSTGVELVREDGTVVDLGAWPMDLALGGQASTGVYRRRDLRRGDERMYRIVAAPVHGPDDAVVAAVVSLRDITDERESERQKDEFLSIVSHELKTPLTPLKALAQLVRLRLRRHREDGRAFDLDSLETNLRTIERQVDRMSGLVNDLLEVSRAGQGRFELQPQEFDLVPLVREVVQRHGELASDDGKHRFTVDSPDAVVITGDAMRLEQALANLVGNAVKYSPSGGDVRVAVEQRDGGVTISVSDQGIGIDPDELPTLARPFARGSRRARTFSGMGIGLYLARLVAERHGGSLAIGSDGEDQGTTVTLKLPRDATKD